MAKATRVCKTVTPMSGDNVFDVSRPNILSNPFTHIKDKKTLAKRVVKDRETAISLYEKYFDEMVSKEGGFKKEFDRMYEAFKSNDEIFVMCYCKLDEACHGDVIIKKLQNRLVKEKLDEITKRKDCPQEH